MKKLIKRYVLKEYLPVILVFATLISIGIYQVIRIGEFEEIFLSTEFDEKVIDVYQEKSYLFVLLTNRAKRLEIRNSFNYDYEDEDEGIDLYSIMKQEDRVIKRKCSDTMFVIKGDKEYHFLIGERLYNNKEKSKEFIQKWNKRRRIVTTNNDCR
ncbi:MAG: hypothetical protein R2825_30815 [Saprospiraceae bacterium]